MKFRDRRSFLLLRKKSAVRKRKMVFASRSSREGVRDLVGVLSCLPVIFHLTLFFLRQPGVCMDAHAEMRKDAGVWAPPPWSLPVLLLLDTGVGHVSRSMLSRGKRGALFLGFPFITRLWACVLSAFIFFLSPTLFKNVFSLYLVPGSQWHDAVGWGWGPTPLTVVWYS